MNEQQIQQAFIQWLAQKLGVQTQEELDSAIQQMGEEGVQRAYQQFMQEIQQAQVQQAKFGAKLNYIKQLNGICPEGTEMQYYKVGGRLCKKCMQKKQDGGYVEDTNPIDAFKCGRKVKKQKKALGGTVDQIKCGKKLKKKALGGTVDQIKTKPVKGCTKKKKVSALGGAVDLTEGFRKHALGGNIDLAKCGKKLKEACKGIKAQQGSKVTSRKPTYPLKDDKGNTYHYSDRATRDSIAANRYNDEDVMGRMPGDFKKNKQGKVRWTPDRTKPPYNKK